MDASLREFLDHAVPHNYFTNLLEQSETTASAKSSKNTNFRMFTKIKLDIFAAVHFIL